METENKKNLESVDDVENIRQDQDLLFNGRLNIKKESAISPYLLRALKQRHSEFGESLCNRLTLYLHSEFNIKLQSASIIQYSQFLNLLSDPTYVVFFKIEPLKGIGFLEIVPDIGFRICERMLGGRPVVIEPNREPTDIEVALIDQVVYIILEEWCQIWAKFEKLRPLILGHESDPVFLNLVENNVKFFNAVFEIEFCGITRNLTLAIQVDSIESFLDKLKPPVQQEPKAKVSEKKEEPVEWNDIFNETPIEVSAQWDKLEMTAREIGSLKLGETILLKGDYSEAIKIKIGGVDKFFGRLGTCDGKWAVEITRLAYPD